jgi:hypothetical protein
MGGTLINLNGSNPAAPSGSTNVSFQASAPYTGANGYQQRDVSASIGAIPESQVTNLTTDLAAKAPLASPALTGTPTAPTPTAGDNSTKIATTAFVAASASAVTSVAGRTGAVTLGESDIASLTTDLAAKAPLASPTFTGTPTAPSPPTPDNTLKLATTAWVNTTISAFAPLASPTFTGTPTAPSPPTPDNTLKLATTAWVNTTISAFAPLASPAFTGTPTAPTPPTSDNTLKLATTAWVNTTISAFAPLASPTFTGTATAPTPTTGDNSTKIATTAFVNAEMAANAPGLGATQSANKVYAGPTSGSAAAPSFRSLVAADIPATLNATQVAGMADFAGSATITSAPPLGSENAGWKATLWGQNTALGVAFDTLVILVSNWASIFGSLPANNATSTTPDTNAEVSLGTDGSVRAAGRIAAGESTFYSGGAEPLEVGSSGAGISLADRTLGFSSRWVIYASGGYLRLYKQGVGDVLSIDGSGNVIIKGTLTQNGSPA